MCVLQGTKEITPDDRIKFEVTDQDVIMTCKEAIKKDDEGRYAITLKNPKGSDTASINVVVIGKKNLLPTSLV